MLGFSIVKKKDGGRLYGSPREYSASRAGNVRTVSSRGSIARSVLDLSRKKRS